MSYVCMQVGEEEEVVVVGKEEEEEEAKGKEEEEEEEELWSEKSYGQSLAHDHQSCDKEKFECHHWEEIDVATRPPPSQSPQNVEEST